MAANQKRVADGTPADLPVPASEAQIIGISTNGGDAKHRRRSDGFFVSVAPPELAPPSARVTGQL